MSNIVQLFEKYKTDKVAIYGLGIEAERVLKQMDSQFQIIGLLDSYREDGEIYGKKIISLQDAINNRVKMILVVARPGSCKAIARKIGETCKSNQIALLDINGRNLCENRKVVYDFQGIQGNSKEFLLHMVKERDVVSVDLFDTLVMRQILFSTDIYELLDEELKNRGIFFDDFAKQRVSAEKELSKHKAPSLVEIYQYLMDLNGFSGLIAEELAELEWSIDISLVVPRVEMCNFLSQMWNMGKEIYIVTDTYYSRTQIEAILQKCGINSYTDVLVSCEYGTSKTQKLFGNLRKCIGKKSCIHIGDDTIADVESAERNGIEACRIYSGIDLWEAVGCLGMEKYVDDLSDRIKLGLFVSRIFNSPFQFETTEKKICVNNANDIGFMFFAPLISDFVLWLNEQVAENVDNIWFGARDGYLIQKLYDCIGNTTKTSVYFLTSRVAAIRAGVKNLADISYIDEMKFSGTVQEQMQERFGIQIPKQVKDKESILDYAKEILSTAEIKRKNYLKYIKTLDRKEGNIAFFDFVAKGTCQMFVEKILNKQLMGLYFLRLEEDNPKTQGLNIKAFYQAEEKLDSVIFDNYYILETMLTAPMPSVLEFDENGKPCYSKETRDDESIKCFSQAQEGISDFFQRYVEICPVGKRNINKSLDEHMLSLVQKIIITDNAFLNLTVEDPFFNRMTDITDLI
ncbi:MAG: HAD hydrolase-like protein [Lachnospiraceae bacterium]|nr:HAD hydrolase-like protein [Lachnospiraceae bacterium]MDY5521435.1 HAD hydrolase-like protein [Agathobacter sp.]